MRFYYFYMAKIPKMNALRGMVSRIWSQNRWFLFLIPFFFSLAAHTQQDPVHACSHKQRAVQKRMVKNIPEYSGFDVTFYALDIALERNTVAVAGNVRIDGKSLLTALDTLVVELVSALTVDSVLSGNQQVPFVHAADVLKIPLPAPLSAGEAFSLKIFYHGLPPTGGFFAGISTDISTQWGNEVTWTLSEPFNAKDWFPVKQDLTDKADSAWIFITTDTANKAGSNGLLTAITPLPGGKHRFEWKTRYPVSYYLLSAAVADYQEYTVYAKPAGFSDSIPIVNYIYDAPGCLAFYQTDLDRTRDFLELFSEQYGLYPFAEEKYGHCQVHLGGGMEHQTMSTMGAFNFELNSHELGHQWFGDHVTCASWSDIWLNEGFATYSQYIAAQHLITQDFADAFMISMQNYVMTEDGGSVYIPPAEADDVWRIFNGRLSYNKGAVILHILRYEINNDALYFTVLRQFLDTYGGSAATGADFFALAGQVCGRSFETFANQWYYGEGFPIYDINWLQAGDTLYIQSRQHTSTTVTPFFAMTLPVKLSFPGGDTLIRLDQSAPECLFTLPFSKQVQTVSLNPAGQSLLKTGTLIQGIPGRDTPPLLSVFPNPVTDEFRIFFRQQGQTHRITLSDIHGREVMQLQTTDPVLKVSLASLESGVYFLVYNKQEAVIRLIKK